MINLLQNERGYRYIKYKEKGKKASTTVFLTLLKKNKGESFV